MFANLPGGFPKLTLAYQNLRKVVIEKPPDVRGLASRLRTQYKNARSSNYENLSISSVRKIPYAYFVDAQPNLDTLEPDLTNRYWSVALTSAMQQGRRSKRWFSPIFFTYCEKFDTQSTPFHTFSNHAVLILKLDSDDLYIQRMQELQKNLSFFQPTLVGTQLGRAFIDPNKTMNQVLEDNFLWPEFLETPLGEHVFLSILGFAQKTLMREDVIEKLLKWSRKGGQPHYPAQRIALANALLLPWHGIKAPETIKTKLVNYFVKHYRDPRLISKGNPGHLWQGISQSAIDTIRRWLVGDTLRGFVQILEQTADTIWQYRQKFWMAYYDAGYIEETWLVLGDLAAARARQLFINQPSMTYGRFSGGATAKQSVLLIKIGGLTFSEWSHNGSLRAFYENDVQAPDFYWSSYSGNDLREAVSLDFHNGQNMRPHLIHSASDCGTWQRKARDFINRETGLYLSDKAIML